MRNVLLLCELKYRDVGTIHDHIVAFEKYSQNNVFTVDMRLASLLPMHLFDVIVVHYSVVLANLGTYYPLVAEKVAHFTGEKVVYIQDEYRWIDATAQAFKDFGVSVVFSVIAPESVRLVYSHEWCDDIQFEYTLTGFVPESYLNIKVPCYDDREIDVSYRARKVAAWIGEHSVQKWQIADRFLEDARRYGLHCDISTREADRIYAHNWVKFIANSKAVLGTESGSSVLDYTGKLQVEVEAYEAAHPEASFEEVRKLFFENLDGKVIINAISPRCFEAAALRTLMILYEGEYNGILLPWKHYVPLNRDHSNIQEVVDVLRDPDRASEIIDQCYTDIIASSKYSHKRMVEHFDRVIERKMDVSNRQGKFSTFGQRFLSQFVRGMSHAYITLGKMLIATKEYIHEFIYHNFEPKTADWLYERLKSLNTLKRKIIG